MRKWTNIRDQIDQHRAEIKQWKHDGHKEHKQNLTPMQRSIRARKAAKQAQQQKTDAGLAVHVEWDKVYEKYAQKVPANLKEKYDTMVQDQNDMTTEFKTKTDELHNMTDRLEKQRKTKEVKQWYEQRDSELFEKNHWASCWLTGQLVHSEFKNNAIMNKQFKMHCPKMFEHQKKTYRNSAWGNTNERQIPHWAQQMKGNFSNRTAEMRQQVQQKIDNAAGNIKAVAQHTRQVARNAKSQIAAAVQEAKDQIHAEATKHQEEIKTAADAAVATANANPNHDESHSSYDENAVETNSKEHGKTYKHSKFTEKETTQFSEY